MSSDQISIERFKIMERKLYYGITWPSGILATIFGLWLFSLNATYYLHQGWMHAKLLFVVGVWGYHLFCGKYFKLFKQDKNHHGHTFYRWFNEFSIVLLIFIVILVVVKPSF